MIVKNKDALVAQSNIQRMMERTCLLRMTLVEVVVVSQHHD